MHKDTEVNLTWDSNLRGGSGIDSTYVQPREIDNRMKSKDFSRLPSMKGGRIHVTRRGFLSRKGGFKLGAATMGV